jgi:hypothetical protein
MSPLSGLADTLYREQIERARAMSPGDKLLEGPRLFERAWRLMAAGIRSRHPELNEDEVIERVRAMLVRVDAIERS